MDSQQENRPLFATQGGGYAVYKDGRYVWHSEIPDFVDAQVGDSIPEEWDVVAVNEAARQEVEEDLLRCTKCGDSECLGLCEVDHMAMSAPSNFWLTDEGQYPPGR